MTTTGSTSGNIAYLFVNWGALVGKRSDLALREILVFLYLQENGLAERAMVEEMWSHISLERYPTVESAANDRAEFFKYDKEKKESMG